MSTKDFIKKSVLNAFTQYDAPKLAVALLAARAGAAYVSPFLGRLDDIGQPGIELIRTISAIFANYPDLDCRIIAASVRNPVHVQDCALAGADIARVGSAFSKIVYYLCVFSMVVPFQMVMFTLPKTADTLKLNTPWTIPIIYLGFGAGLAVFMFSGFVKSIPLSIEEAAAIDGCGPVKTFFSVVLPMMKPTMISVGVLEIMWVWNDYLLPYLVLDRKKYMTIPIHIQYLKGSYGSVDMGATMALILLSILPVIIFYLTCQKYIIKGVAAGAVKG